MTSAPSGSTADLKATLYAALKHEKSCVCGECSGGLNAVDDLCARVSALEAVAAAVEVCRDIYEAEQGDERNFWQDGWLPLRLALDVLVSSRGVRGPEGDTR